MLTLSINISFSPRETVPQVLPLTTLKAFGGGNDLPYSDTASAWAE